MLHEALPASAGTRIVRTAVFAGHLVLAPMPALPQAGLQLAVDSGAFLIATLALACQVMHHHPHFILEISVFLALCSHAQIIHLAVPQGKPNDSRNLLVSYISWMHV